MTVIRFPPAAKLGSNQPIARRTNWFKPLMWRWFGHRRKVQAINYASLCSIESR